METQTKTPSKAKFYVQPFTVELEIYDYDNKGTLYKCSTDLDFPCGDNDHVDFTVKAERYNDGEPEIHIEYIQFWKEGEQLQELSDTDFDLLYKEILQAVQII